MSAFAPVRARVPFLISMTNDPLPKRPGLFHPNWAFFISASLALVLLAALLPIPRPTAISSQPWKIELLASILFLLVGIVIYRRRARLDDVAGLRDRHVRAMILSISAFIAWSGLSAMWALSTASAIHHTLEWSLYLMALIGALYLISLHRGYSIILRSLVLVAAVLGTLCLIDYLTLIDFASAEGPIRVRYGRYAELLVTASPVLAVFTFYVGRRRSWFAMLAVWLLSWVTVMLSLSKGAFLAGVLSHAILFAGCFFLSKRRRRQKTAILAGIWLAATLTVQVLFSTASAIPSTTDYISGAADQTRGTSQMRVFTWRVGLKMATSHLITGVGADNFGVAFNAARAEMAAKQPQSGPEVAEDYLVERAHNEFLQILAELGVPGALFIVGLFGAFAMLVWRSFRQNNNRLSPVLWSAIAGMTAFSVSSLVSSFSFRAVQNGIAFFLVLGVAITEMVKTRSTPVRKYPAGWLKPVISICLGLTVLMLVYCGSKAVAECYFYQAERTRSFAAAENYYRNAIGFDPDYAAAYYYMAARYAAENDNSMAALTLRQGIDRGFGVTLTYSLLARYQLLAGDDGSAQRTFDEALSVFPNSAYVRVRYAIFLEDRGQASESAGQLDAARSIDQRQANGWYWLIRDGSVAAFYKAQGDQRIAPPAELLPPNAVIEFVDEQKFGEDDQSRSGGTPR